MATIKATTNEKIVQLQKWLGLNQCEDADTQLKIGEAANMWNFRITDDGHLQKRPGTLTVVDFESDSEVKCLWYGKVNGNYVLLAACDGKLYNLWNGGDFAKTQIGSVSTSGNVHIFGFSGIAYILDGADYYQWDGTTLSSVAGYRPLVTIAVPPSGGGETMEEVNRLCGMRRCWISPDGTEKTFHLPETNLLSVDYVKNLTNGSVLPSSDYSVNLTAGTVTFSSAPAESVNSYEIGWTVLNAFRTQVTNMRFSELYNSTQDTRVFLYGDGSNKALYSGIDYDGTPRADYFPDLFEMTIGDSNTPITAMIRHYSRLVCYKSTSTYLITYGEYTRSDGTVTAAFYSMPVNRIIGNEALGQAQLVLNSPRTLFGKNIYEWHNNGSYASNLSVDERQAKNISERVSAVLEDFSFEHCKCFDDNFNQEYYVCYNKKALVHNYAVDVWYYYTDFDAACMVSINGDAVIGTSDGKVKRVSYSYTSDDGDPIECYWESGSMSFGQDYERKYAATIWVSIAPEEKSSIQITAETDRTVDIADKELKTDISTFSNVDFADFTFKFDARPKVCKLKIKAKKFVFYKLIFKCDNGDSHATVLSTDIRVRFTGYAK